MIDPSGSKRQVSPPNVNASTPMISPDSKWIAFTGVSV
jgi:Tol biopolymer transport system component